MFVVIVVVVINDVINVGNFMDFQWCPSNFLLRGLDEYMVWMNKTFG